MNKINRFLKKILRPKLLYSLMLFAVLAGMVKLFSFSTYEAKEDRSHQLSFNQNYKIFSLNIPNDINFAGERVPMEDFDVREKLDRELLVNTYWQSQTLLFIKRSNRWFPVIEPILKKNGVPEDFKYLALIESGLMNVISPAGATGYWQFMKSAADEYGLEVNGEIDERYHMEKSTEAACKYLREAHSKFGSWTLAAASYNMGMSGLRNQLDRQKSKNYYDLLLNEETSRYLFRIMAAKEILENREKYGFYLRAKDLYHPVQSNEIEIDSAVADFADFAHKNGINYRLLKTLNPWLRDNYISNKHRKKYKIKLPEEQYIKLISTEDTIEAKKGPEYNDLLPEKTKADFKSVKHSISPSDSLSPATQKDSIALEDIK